MHKACALTLPLQLYNEQLAIGVQPSGSTLAMLINAFCTKAMWDDALGLLSSMCRCVLGHATDLVEYHFTQFYSAESTCSCY